MLPFVWEKCIKCGEGFYNLKKKTELTTFLFLPVCGLSLERNHRDKRGTTVHIPTND